MESEQRTPPETLAVLVVGTDTLIEALPARPIQLAHACGALGFDLVIPLSWGDELVAEAALRTLESRSPGPAVLCSCPLVRERLLQTGADLEGAMVSLAPSPAAVARHLRATIGNRLGSLSYVGRCPGASTPEYDVSYDPPALFSIFRDQGIQIESQPDEYQDRLPADRRRFVSLPGGCPSPDHLWQRCNEMTLVEIEATDLIELAQHLLSPHPVLVDVAATLGCHCCGVTHSTTDFSAKVAVASLEPPRSTTPIVTYAVVPELTVAVTEPARGFSGGASSERTPMAVTPPSALRIGAAN
jgi:hypothetical protein